MIKIDKKIIDTDTDIILRSLRSYVLSKNGREVLHDIIPSYDNVMITCPFHKDGKERKPSCGISTKDKRINGKEIPAGTVHCFTCGKTTSIDKLISYLLGFEDSGEEGKKWLFDNFEISFTRDIKIEPITREISSSNTSKIIKDNLLDQYRYIHPYMYKRGLTDEIIQRYDIGFDKITNSITFPVRDIKGNCLFLAKRSVNTKLFILPSDSNKPLYGVYELDYNNPEVYICESFFNALTLAKWGYNAIALMGTGSFNQYPLINKLPFRIFHIVLDGDKAGIAGTERLVKNITKDKIVYVYNMFPGKDVNDLSYEEFKKVPYDIRS